MSNKKILAVFIFFVLAIISFAYFKKPIFSVLPAAGLPSATTAKVVEPVPLKNPLMIRVMREKQYPGSDLIIEKKLSAGVNYNQYIASYISDGLKIYGLLMVPTGPVPAGGWPGIIFLHGYIQPDQYTTTGNYAAYVAAIARSGYVVFKPDLRGHGNSQGVSDGDYYSPAYVTDSLNALASLKNYSAVNPSKLGMWGHSMGGYLIMKSIEVNTTDIKAAVIWGGLTASYYDIINNWRRKVTFKPNARDIELINLHCQELIAAYGSPTSTSTFWNSVDPMQFLSDIRTPVQLHTGGNDERVPPEFSQNFAEQLRSLGKTAEYYNYPGGNHNISNPNFSTAMNRSINFFNQYLK